MDYKAVRQLLAEATESKTSIAVRVIRHQQVCVSAHTCALRVQDLALFANDPKGRSPSPRLSPSVLLHTQMHTQMHTQGDNWGVTNRSLDLQIPLTTKGPTPTKVDEQTVLPVSVIVSHTHTRSSVSSVTNKSHPGSALVKKISRHIHTRTLSLSLLFFSFSQSRTHTHTYTNTHTHSLSLSHTHTHTHTHTQTHTHTHTHTLKTHKTL